MNKIIGILGILLVLGMIGCTSDNSNSEMTDEIAEQNMPDVVATQPDLSNEGIGYIDISVEMARDVMDLNPELIVIDVSPNYAKGHLPGAINYYVGDGSLDAAIPSLDNMKEYLVYCHVDSAAILGAQKLVDAGFMNVYRLEGNYAAWVNAGYP
ncbi:MAG: rhodanese-like domain-containing protein, partial [Nanoarchaeota archaeon]